MCAEKVITKKKLPTAMQVKKNKKNIYWLLDWKKQRNSED